MFFPLILILGGGKIIFFDNLHILEIINAFKKRPNQNQ